MSDMQWLDAIHIGDTFSSPNWVEMTAEAIVNYATVFDPQPGHLSEELALDTPFKGLAASGWHTAAVTMKLLTSLGLNESIGLSTTVTWPTPTRPGDRLKLSGRVTGKRPSKSKPGHAIIELDYETVNQDGEVRQRTQTTMLASYLVIPLGREGQESSM